MIVNIITTEHLRFASPSDADPNTRLFAALQDQKVGVPCLPRDTFKQCKSRAVDVLPAHMYPEVLGGVPRPLPHARADKLL